jgi:hypothetical protein
MVASCILACKLSGIISQHILVFWFINTARRNWKAASVSVIFYTLPSGTIELETIGLQYKTIRASVCFAFPLIAATFVKI